MANGRKASSPVSIIKEEEEVNEMAFLAASTITMGEAVGNTLVGFGVVFVTLLFLSGVISLLKPLGKLDKSAQKKEAAPAKPAAKTPAASSAPAKPAGIGGEDPAVVAVILAAVAATCGPQAKVTSIQRSR